MELSGAAGEVARAICGDARLRLGIGKIKIANGELAGVDVSWAGPKNRVANTLPNEFDPWTYAYDIDVPGSNKEIGTTPIALSSKISSLKINGVSIKSGASRTIAVNDGAEIRIDVVAPDGFVARRQIVQVLVRSLGSEPALHKPFELVAEKGAAQQDLDLLFAALDPDAEGVLDGVRDIPNQPFEDEPERVQNDLRAVSASCR